MLIRFFINNAFSFGEDKEFNMIPGPNGKRLKEHKYLKNDFSVLKLSSIYGANAAGKSNLVRALDMLRDIIVDEKLYVQQAETQFKFRDDKIMPQIIGFEFFHKEKAFYYALKIIGYRIDTEELYVSGLGKQVDKLIFERKTDEKGITTIHFFDDFENDKESETLKNVIEKNLAKPHKPIFKLLTTLDNPYLADVNVALDWVENALQIISPNSRPAALAHGIDIDPDFKKYAQDTMCAFHVGINRLVSERKTLDDFLGKENDVAKIKILHDIDEAPNNMLNLKTKGSKDSVIIVKEDNDVLVKQLKLEHSGKNGKKELFDLDEESDGTIRLLDFIPAFRDVFSKEKVYIIDEIERSIHPLLIKELIRKFSSDNNTKGQLVFTTHESNLLDQSIFRQDEIWFAEKDKNGCTDLYSLSDFKEHSTIDIRKGYLTGRYGSIPFLANLHDLNWHSYDTKE